MDRGKKNGAVVEIINKNKFEELVPNGRTSSGRAIWSPNTSVVSPLQVIKKLQKNVVAGYVLTCIGDNRNYSMLESKQKNSLSDIVAKHILKQKKKVKIYDWSMRGSDERQYCSSECNLPVGQLARTVYGQNKEYHTSADDKKFVKLIPMVFKNFIYY